MLAHVLKYIWNCRRQNASTFIEIIIVSVVLFFTIDFIVVQVRLYLMPTGISVDHVWQLELINRKKTDEVDRKAHFQQVKELIKGMPEVECVTILRNFPFMQNYRSYGGFNEIHYFNEKVTDDYFQVTGLELVKGRWFSAREVETEAGVAVITSDLAGKYFHKDSVLGHTKRLGRINNDENPEIIGVVHPIKYTDFERPQSTRFSPCRIDELFSWAFPQIAIRVKPGVKDFPKIFDQAVREKVRTAEFGMFSLKHVDSYRKQANQKVTNQIVIYGVVTGFLLLTIFLGIGGIFWKRVLMRRSEIGLRMAVGATSHKVNAQITTEVVCLVLLAIIPAVLICVNLAHAELLNTEFFPVSVWRTLSDISITLLLLLVMAILSTRYPAKQAAKVQPVEALRSNQ